MRQDAWQSVGMFLWRYPRGFAIKWLFHVCWTLCRVDWAGFWRAFMAMQEGKCYDMRIPRVEEARQKDDDPAQSEPIMMRIEPEGAGGR